MKKIFTIFLTIFLLLVWWLCFDYYSQKSYIEEIDKPGKIVNFILDDSHISRKDFVQILCDACENNSTWLYTCEYPKSGSSLATDIFDLTIYTTNMEPYSSNLIRGTIPEPKSDGYIATSTIKTSAQTGEMRLFNNSYLLKVKYFNPSVTYLYGRDYVIVSNKSQTFNSFFNELKRSGITVQFKEETVPNNVISYEFGVKVVLFAILFIMLIFWTCYIIIANIKFLGICLLHGMSKLKTGLYFIRLFFLGPWLYAILISTFLSLTIMFFFNRLFSYWHLLKIQSLLTLVIIISFYIISFISILLTTVCVSIKAVTKNKKNLKPINVLGLLYKAIVCFFFLKLILSVNGIYGQLNKIENNYDSWTHLSSYANIPIYLNNPNDAIESYHTGVKCRELFKKENGIGGVLMHPDSALIMPPEFVEESSKDINSPYFWRNNGVKINNNYLKSNPIIDDKGRKVDLSMHENNDSLVILVPEKYKQYETILKEDFIETYNFYSYADENYFLELTKQNIPHRKNKDVNIIYVKNDQKYHLWNIDYAANGTDYILDPIGIVVNNVNFGGDVYLASISAGDFYIPWTNTQNSNVEFQNTIYDLHLENNIYETVPAFDRVSSTMKLLSTQYRVNLSLLILVILVMLILSIFTSLFLFASQKSKMAIFYIHGYSILRSCNKIYYLSTIFYSTIFILTVITDIENKYMFQQALILLALLLIDCLIMILVFNSAKITTILKEGESS